MNPAPICCATRTIRSTGIRWGPEALAAAEAQNKPILLSIGYTACHWCHVMEKESFADAETAALMNENFINIKVDREERPDIDQLYQAAANIMGHAGRLAADHVPHAEGRARSSPAPIFRTKSASASPRSRKCSTDVAELYREQSEQVAQTTTARDRAARPICGTATCAARSTRTCSTPARSASGNVSTSSSAA